MTGPSQLKAQQAGKLKQHEGGEQQNGWVPAVWKQADFFERITQKLDPPKAGPARGLGLGHELSQCHTILNDVGSAPGIQKEGGFSLAKPMRPRCLGRRKKEVLYQESHVGVPNLEDRSAQLLTGWD